MSEQFLAYSSRPNPDWSDRRAVIDHIVGLLRIYSGGSGYFDEATMRALIALELDRTASIASSQINHFVMDTGDPIWDRLGEILAPTLVIHGSQDPIFPLGHARVLTEEIPDATLLTLPGIGHELPLMVWDVVVPAIVEHTSGGSHV